MASITHDINLLINANTTGLSAGLASARTQLSGFAGGLESAAEPVANFTKGLLASEAALLGVGVAFIGLSVKEAGRFSDAIGGLGALFNGTSEQVNDLGDDLLNFSKTSVSSFEAIEEAAFIAISTGTDYAEVTDSLAVAQKLAVAGSSDLVTATSTLSRALNAYGKDASDAESFSDALFLAAQQGDTNFTALGQSLGIVSGTAAAAKVPFSDLLAGVTSLTIETGQTSESMTKLKTLFTELSSPSDVLKQALGGLRLDTDGLAAVMDRLRVVSGGTQYGMNALFSSSEAVSAALILANDSAGKFNSTLTLMGDRAGIVEENYLKMANSFSASNQKVANNLRALLIETGKPLLDEYGSLADSIASIFDKLGLSIKDGALSQLSKAVENFAGDAADRLEAIAKALPAALDRLNFDDLLDSFGDLGAELKDILDSVIGSGLDLSKPEDLAKALQKGVDLLQTMVVVTRGILIEFKPIFAAIGETITRISQGDDELGLTVGKILGALTAIAEFGVAIGAVLVVVQETGTDVSRLFDVLQGAVKIFTNGIHSSFLLLQDLMARVAVDFNNILASITVGDASKRFEAEAQKWLEITEQIERDIAENGRDIADGWELMAGESAKSTEKIIKNTDDLGKASKDSSNIITQASKAAGDGIKEGFEGAAEPIEKLSDGLNFAANEFEEFVKKEQQLTNAGFEFTSTWNEAGGTIAFLAEETIKAADATDLKSDSDAKAIANIEKITAKTNELTETQKRSQQQVFELRKAQLEFAAEERIAAIEFSSNIQVAAIESDSKRAVAAYEAISESVKNTGEVFGGTFDTLAGGFASGDISAFDLSTLERLSERQFDLQEKALDSQIEMNTAEVELRNAQTRQLAEGRAAIEINVDGLEPEMKAMMLGIFRVISIEANFEGQQLLGII